MTSDSDCRVHFEPEGADHALRPGDAFRIELPGPPEYLAITHSQQALSIWVQGCEVRAWDSADRELAL